MISLNRRGEAFVVTQPDAPLSRGIEQLAQELGGLDRAARHRGPEPAPTEQSLAVTPP